MQLWYTTDMINTTRNEKMLKCEPCKPTSPQDTSCTDIKECVLKLVEYINGKLATRPKKCVGKSPCCSTQPDSSTAECPTAVKPSGYTDVKQCLLLLTEKLSPEMLGALKSCYKQCACPKPKPDPDCKPCSQPCGNNPVTSCDDISPCLIKIANTLRPILDDLLDQCSGSKSQSNPCASSVIDKSRATKCARQMKSTRSTVAPTQEVLKPLVFRPIATTQTKCRAPSSKTAGTVITMPTKKSVKQMTKPTQSAVCCNNVYSVPYLSRFAKMKARSTIFLTKAQLDVLKYLRPEGSRGNSKSSIQFVLSASLGTEINEIDVMSELCSRKKKNDHSTTRHETLKWKILPHPPPYSPDVAPSGDFHLTHIAQWHTTWLTSTSARVK
nr:expressed protein [Hymenolepis microstoma]